MVRRLCERLRIPQYYNYRALEDIGRFASCLKVRVPSYVKLKSDSLSVIKGLSSEESNISEGWIVLKYLEDYCNWSGR
jgi:hypothetical protein